jgi:aryl-alcohol dehydrogenase-like predicted oxidoreductase
MRHVVDSGVTFPGTAGGCGRHSNEQLIREAINPYPEDLVIATKGGFVRRRIRLLNFLANVLGRAVRLPEFLTGKSSSGNGRAAADPGLVR